jgi:hypothetical protein
MKVFVAHYEHRHGDDIRVFATEEAAEKWRQAVADEWWEHEMEGDPPSNPEELADEYFDRMGERYSDSEYFSVYEREVEE